MSRWRMLQGRPVEVTRRERGAVLVELAFVALFLLVVIAGTYDYGQAWRAGLAINEASRTAARVGSAQGTTRAGDFNALSGAKAALVSNGRLGDVERVVVFSAGTDGKIPAGCKTGSTAACQVILGPAFRTNWESQAVNTATTPDGCLQVAYAKNWCPTARNNVQLTAQYYGVWIKYRYDHEFSVFGTDTSIERTTTMRLEPKVT